MGKGEGRGRQGSFPRRVNAAMRCRVKRFPGRFGHKLIFHGNISFGAEKLMVLCGLTCSRGDKHRCIHKLKN
jgi:hypothetical protein